MSLISKETQQRFDELVEKRHDESITSEELAELIAITDEVEILHAARLANLIEIARQQSMSLDSLLVRLANGDELDS